MEAFSKTVHPGTLPGELFGRTAPVPVFARIEWTGTRLSITGVEGPKSNGDAVGSAGQMDMSYAHRNPADNDRRTSNPTPADAFTFAGGWSADLWLDFLDVWKRWHLNDMSPACEHQRALGWVEMASEERTVYHWRLSRDVTKQVRAALKAAEEALRRGETVALPEDVATLARMPDRVATSTETPPAPLYEPNGPQYEGDHYNRASETKTRGWLRPSEHPDGLLTAPCPECGYQYGSEWRSEEVPAEVLAFLAGLPNSSRAPAWV